MDAHDDKLLPSIISMEEEHSNTSSDSEAEPPKIYQPQHNGPRTGVKGVIADYQHHQQQASQASLASQATLTAAAAHRSLSRPEELPTFRRQPDAESDSDLDGGDEVMREYREQRMAELQASLVRRVSAGEYVDVVESHRGSRTRVVVVLATAGDRLASLMCEVAPGYPQAVFLQVDAQECGFRDPAVVPIVLVYRDGELEHNLVRVASRFSDPAGFEARDVAGLLDELLLK